MADKDLLFVSSAAVDRENDTFISHIDDYPCNHRFFVLFFLQPSNRIRPRQMKVKGYLRWRSFIRGLINVHGHDEVRV